MRRGELYRLHNPPGDPKQYRVFVVVGRQSAIETRFSTVICAPVMTEGQDLATQVSIGIEEGMKHESWIHCDNLRSVGKSELTRYVGSVAPGKMLKVDYALTDALDLPN